MLFIKPKTYVFVQDLRDRNMFKMGDKFYTEDDINKVKQDINYLNSFLVKKQMFKKEELNKVIVVVFKEGKSIL